MSHKLSSLINKYFKKIISPSTPGANIIISKDNKIIFEHSYGLADLINKIPLNKNHLFHIASASKQMTSVAIMQLQEKGLLQYDDKITKYLPIPQLSNITIRSLLTHTSGLIDYTQPLLKELLKIRLHPTNEDMLQLLKTTEITLQPIPIYTKFRYSNLGYDLLGSLIEHLSNQTYQAYLQANIFKPLHLKHTFSQPDLVQSTTQQLAHSYTRNKNIIQQYDSTNLDNLVGSGSIYTTARDFLTYSINIPKLLTQESLTESYKPIKLQSTTSHYGFGYSISHHKSHPYYHHQGSWLGFNTYYITFPNQSLTIIILLNYDYYKSTSLDNFITRLYQNIYNITTS
jgi:CubicO group peptidase (beta-lactamase class C family)